jgi:HlyD family secretion protein
MDIKREGVAKRKRIKFVFLALVTLGVAGFLTWRLYKLPPAVPTVERATELIDTVKRGGILIDVKGSGTLVPEDPVLIQAANEGQVSKIMVKSGERVKPETVLLVLTNPDLELASNDLEWQVKQAQADLRDLQVNLESQRLNQQAVVSSVESDAEQAGLTKDRDEQLLKMKLKSDLEVKLSVAKWKDFVNKADIEKKRLDIMAESTSAQMDGKKVQVEKLQAQWNLKKQQVADLAIRAGTDGVLQEMTLQYGQRVKPGDALAKVVQPWKLKAEVKIAETQAKDIMINQVAQIDTRNGIIPAHVIRIDPNVLNGTRTIDCKLEGPLPPGAVPDLSVDGTVEIERMADVVYVGRPVFGQAFSSVGLFKLDQDGQTASRVTVKLGRLSVTSAQVLEGLKVGDQVILSDMSGQDQSPKVRLN